MSPTFKQGVPSRLSCTAIRYLAAALVAAAIVITASACSQQPAGDGASEPIAAEAVDFNAAIRTEFSQFGEDGVIEKIFELIEPTAKYVVEFGAFDGVHNSNSRNLILNKGWGGLQMEGHPERAADLVELYKDNPKVTGLHAWIWPGNIEVLFEDNDVPRDLDVLVVDIDSNDYYVWKAIHNYRPKLVLIEFNPTFGPEEKAVITYHPMNYWDHTNYIGASIRSMYDLAKSKGYELVYVMPKGGNLFFVAKEYFPRFGIKDNSPQALWQERLMPNKTPTEYPIGKKKLPVGAFTIPKIWIHDR